MKTAGYIVMILAACIAWGCAADENKRETTDTDKELTISGISDREWTYISLESNAVVGKSPKDDAEADSLWARRTDWDIAICGDMIRTNSGTSGHGNGGIRRLDDKGYDDVTNGDIADVDADSVQTPDKFR